MMTVMQLWKLLEVVASLCVVDEIALVDGGGGGCVVVVVMLVFLVRPVVMGFLSLREQWCQISDVLRNCVGSARKNLP